MYSNSSRESEFVDDVVDEVKILAHQVARRNFLLLAEVDQLAVEAVARGAPLVLHDQARGDRDGIPDWL